MVGSSVDGGLLDCSSEEINSLVNSYSFTNVFGFKESLKRINCNCFRLVNLSFYGAFSTITGLSRNLMVLFCLQFVGFPWFYDPQHELLSLLQI